MRDNLFDDSNPSSLKNKFWSYVKCFSKSSNIPEHVYHNNVHTTHSTRKANLFNTFFFKQFSSPSEYSIKVNFTDDEYAIF